MKIDKKVYINNFDSISCAGNNSMELFDSICQQKDTITINCTYIKGKNVAIGEIDSPIKFDQLLLQKCENVLTQSNLDDFSDTLLVIGSSVGGISTTEKIYFVDKNYNNIDPQKHSIDAIAYFLKQHFSFCDDISFSTACTSSANALGYAKEVIQKNI